ncbi:MAG: hypothetical protein LH472_05725, partial [Pyrinomonadaceae bacterium]|nr:hypothetical protein [Pyrinomonadaceae bacterium]
RYCETRFVISTEKPKLIPEPLLPISAPVYSYSTPTPKPVFSPTPVDNPNLLEFGSEGTDIGAFQNADAIGVDKQGRIYVGDESLRVQQFDDKGNFINLWQIPTQTENYKRARRINKIAVADDERIFIAVGGVILVYKQDSDEAIQTIHNAPDYIVDFALRSDGGVLVLTTDDRRFRQTSEGNNG